MFKKILSRLDAIERKFASVGPPPPPPGAQPTIGFSFDGRDRGDSAANDYTLAGQGFLGGETVSIDDAVSGSALISVTADKAGRYSTVVAINAGTSLQLSARGQQNGRVSNTISFVA